MDMNTIINLATQILGPKLGVDTQKIQQGISALFSEGFDVQKLLSAVSGSDLGSIVSSWIGSGNNLPIDVEGVKKIFGENKIKEFANITGVDENKATSALSEALPEIVDKLTPDGDDMLSNLGSIGDFAKKFF
jgi:uncharacterized protein YidB (DUF937 family)